MKPLVRGWFRIPVPRTLVYLLALCLLCIHPLLQAATQNALVTGSVYDQRNGAAIPGAAVRLINASTGFSQQRVTDANGIYTFPSVPPAPGYLISVEKGGYATSILQDQEINVGDNKLILPPFLLQSLAPTPSVAAAAPAPTEPEKPAEVARQPVPTAPPSTQPVAPPTTPPVAPPAEQPAAPAPIAPAAPAVAAATPPAPAPVHRVAHAPTVSMDFVTSTVGGVVDSTAVHTLPLAGRDFLDLALLVMGTYPVEQGSTLAGASIVVNGTRANMNNFLLDGVDNNDYTINQSLPFQIIEAMQEFRVQTSTSTAEYGRSGGAQINAISRSGSNTFHGTLFEFNRNAALSSMNALTAYKGGSFDGFAQYARQNEIWGGPNPYDPAACANQGICGGTLFPTPILSDPTLAKIYDQGRNPRINENQFGANLGGPIVKNKAFFFANWESLRADNPRPVFERVPSTYYRASRFAIGPSTTRANALLNLYPVPNVPYSTVTDVFGFPVSDPKTGDFPVLPLTPTTGSFFVGDSRDFSNSDNFLERVDLRPNDRATLSFKHNIQRINQVQGGTLPATSTYPGNGTEVRGRNQNFSFNYVDQLSDRTVNELRLGWNRFRLSNLPLDRTFNPSGLFNNLNFTDQGLPTFLIGGFNDSSGPYANLGSTFSAPSQRANNVWSVGENISHTSGRHVLKFGAEGRYNRLDVNNSALGRGLVTIFTAGFGADFGLPDLASIARVAPEFGGVDGRGGYDRSFRAKSLDWFAQDTWQARPGLSITMGIRYELNQAPMEARNRLVNDYPGACAEFACLMRSGSAFVLGSNGGIENVAKFIAPRAGFKTDFNNYGPHVGIAWSPWNSRKTVFRAGYAVAYDQQPLQASANMLLNPPYVQQWTSFFPFVGLGDTFPAGFPNQPYGIFDLNGEGINSIWFRNPFSIVARDPNTRSSYVQQFNFGIQQRVSNTSLFEIAYVGAIGHKLPLNRLLLACTSADLELDPLSCLPLPQNSRGRYFPSQSVKGDSIIMQENAANSNFHALEARWETRGFHGMTFRFNYQWAHSIDNASTPVAPVFMFAPGAASFVKSLGGINVDQFASINNANPALSLRPGLPIITTTPLLPNASTNDANLSGERASSDFDVRHRFVISYIYEVPRWQRLKAMGSGWTLAGVTTLQKGQPFTVFGDFYGVPLRPDQVGPAALNYNNPGAAVDGAIPAGCNVPGPFGFVELDCTGTSAVSAFDINRVETFLPGSLGRNTFRSPGIINFDFSVLKNTYLMSRERLNLQFRAEFFNLFNNVNYLQPYSQMGQFASYYASFFYAVPNPFFGQILQARPPRQIQFAVKFVF
ncbi:MAG: TonB-dependent receptor [Acidobacteriia bacterium]|nr:TonB-dependent receptor [Terriglobia bacterium]